MVAITTGTRAAALAMALGLGLLGGAARAQQLKDVQMPKEPLVLAQQGSFFVGGHPTHIALTEWEELGADFAKAFGEPGEATVDQMYVQFQKPPGSESACSDRFPARLLPHLQDLGDDARRAHGLV